MSRKGKALNPAQRNAFLDKILGLATEVERKITNANGNGDPQCPKTNPKK